LLDYAIIMLDPQGRVTAWNAGAERIKGYRAEEVIGEHFLSLLSARGRGGWQAAARARDRRDPQGGCRDEGWRGPEKTDRDSGQTWCHNRALR